MHYYRVWVRRRQRERKRNNKDPLASDSPQTMEDFSPTSPHDRRRTIKQKEVIKDEEAEHPVIVCDDTNDNDDSALDSVIHHDGTNACASGDGDGPPSRRQGEFGKGAGRARFQSIRSDSIDSIDLSFYDFVEDPSVTIARNSFVARKS